MSSMTLVVMAAGIGSRYGGLKQVDPVGPSGEIVIDYSVYDALKAGFDKVVFIIRKDIESVFREKIGRNVEKRVDTAYVFQSLDQLPPGFEIPAGRVKPWGTAQAILAARDEVPGAFAAVNADDFYGRTAFSTLAAYMKTPKPAGPTAEYAMIGYILDNTLSDHGHVARGICEADPDGCLMSIAERLRVQRFSEGPRYAESGEDWIALDPDCLVSMNMWGFTPDLFRELEIRFPLFLESRGAASIKAEFLIPEVVGDLVRGGQARVKILPTREKWFGVTYPEDMPLVRRAVRRLVDEGLYPEKLWAQT
jgi:hypothetical protein